MWWTAIVSAIGLGISLVLWRSVRGSVGKISWRDSKDPRNYRAMRAVCGIVAFAAGLLIVLVYAVVEALTG